MPTPDKPTLYYSYSAFQQAQGGNGFPGTQMDNDLANLKQAIDETIDFASLAIRSDGKLQNGIVTRTSLAADVYLGAIGATRPWAAGFAYAVNDTATQANVLYICLVAHTSGTFATDLSTGKWAVLIEFTVPVSTPDGSLTEPKYATGSVSTRALADGAVTAAKIPNASITAAKLAAQVGVVPVGAEMQWGGPFLPAGWLRRAGQAVSRVTYTTLYNVLAPAFVATVTNTSATISGVPVDLRGLGLEGKRIEGAGIPVNATIVAVTLTTITISANATASSAATQIRVFPHGNGDGSTTFNLPATVAGAIIFTGVV